MAVDGDSALPKTPSLGHGEQSDVDHVDGLLYATKRKTTPSSLVVGNGDHLPKEWVTRHTATSYQLASSTKGNDLHNQVPLP